jgi:amino acid transporter
MATRERTDGGTEGRLRAGQLGLLGVIMPGVAQIAPAFNLFFTTGVIAGYAGAAVPLIFLISMVGVVATASSLAQFSRRYPSSGSFLTYISRTLGGATASAVGIITLLGYIITFGGIYVFVGNYIVQNVLGNPNGDGLTDIVTVVYGLLVTAPVIVGLKFGVRLTIALYAFEVVLLLTLSVAFLAQGGSGGLSVTPFTLTHGSDVLLGFSGAIIAFGGFEACAPLAEETANPRRNVPIALLVSVIFSGLIYILGSYAIVIAFGVKHISALVINPNPFHAAASVFISALAPLVTWVFLSSVTSSYVAANTQTARVIFGGARGRLWARPVAAVSPRFGTPWLAAVAFVAPSIVIGVGSTLFTNPSTASGFLATYGILGVIVMYLMVNVCLVVKWVRDRSDRGHWFTNVVVPVLGIGVLAIPVWGDLKPGQPSPYDALPWLTACLIAAGVLYAGYLRVARPEALAAAPALLEGSDC